jgi:tRNA threonylcarbamoyladenosine biosynthesis protein TsaB
MSLILGIDTSSTELSLGLCEHGQPIAAATRYTRHSHAEHIAQSVSTILSSSGYSVEAIDRVAISIGPGSFTGLRIGISFVKGLCFERGPIVAPVSSLEIVANAFYGNTGDVAVALEARRGNVFAARFSRSDETVTRISEDAFMSAIDFRNQCTPGSNLAWDPADKISAPIPPFEGLCIIPITTLGLNRGLHAALIASRFAETSTIWKQACDLEPLYFQPSYAEFPKTVVNQ